MSVKDKKSDVFNYFKVKREFLAKSHIISSEQRVFKHIFAFVLMQISACLKEHTREAIHYVFCALCMVCPSSAVG